MNKIKWMISDLDGTLLNHNKKEGGFVVDKKTITEINNAISLGIHFTVATGRHYADALNIIKPIINSPRNSFVIGMNGGQIFSIDDNKLIYNSFIDSNLKPTLEMLMNQLIAKYKNILFFAYCENEEIIFIKNSGKHFDELVNNAISYEQNKSVFTYKRADSIQTLPKILKICIKFLEKFSDPWEIVDECINISNDFDFVPSGDVYIEIIPKGISKGKAIDYINDNFYKFNKNEIIVFGDSGNDLDMFTRSIISVTRDCAPDYVKNKVSHVYHGGPSTFMHNAILDLVELDKNK